MAHTIEERKEAQERVIKIIGTREQAIGGVEDLAARINRSNRWKKEFDNLVKVFLEHGAEALSMNFMQFGNEYHGVTANGKKWILSRNHGFTERSWYCGTLWIQGIGTVFTSGRLDKVFDYIFKN